MKTMKNLKTICMFFGLGLLLMGLTPKKEKPFPDFKLVTITGDTLSQKDFIGKVTVINMWATWCVPCIEEIPSLNTVYNKYKDDKNILFVALTDDNKEKIVKFLTNKEFKYVQITDAASLIKKLQSGIISVRPMHLIVNKKGQLVERKSGGDKVADFLTENIEKYKAE